MADAWGGSWGSSWGVSWGRVAQVRRGGGLIVRIHDDEDETPEERRARIFSEMVDDLEELKVNERKEQKAVVKAAAKVVRKIARQEPERADEYNKFLAALKRIEAAKAEQQRIQDVRDALSIAYGIELSLLARQRNEQALIALLLAD